MMPSIHVYAVCWNEERMLPYFLRHYTRFAERVTIFDNESTDRSVKIASSFERTTVHSFSTGGRLDEAALTRMRNTMWLPSCGQAQWVIVVDVDELIYHDDVLGYLARCSAAGATVAWPVGYEMVSRTFPVTTGQIYDVVKFGSPRPKWNDKPVVFDPNAIESMHFDPGSHTANPTGRVVVDAELAMRELKLLHYHMLGVDYMLPRYQARRERLTQEMRDKAQGLQYHFDADRIVSRISKVEQQAGQVVP